MIYISVWVTICPISTLVPASTYVMQSWEEAAPNVHACSCYLWAKSSAGGTMRTVSLPQTHCVHLSSAHHALQIRLRYHTKTTCDMKYNEPSRVRTYVCCLTMRVVLPVTGTTFHTHLLMQANWVTETGHPATIPASYRTST